MTELPKPLLTVEQVADYLTISKQSVRRMADDGTLPRVRVGPGRRLIRFRLADVEAHVATLDAEPRT